MYTDLQFKKLTTYTYAYIYAYILAWAKYEQRDVGLSGGGEGKGDGVRQRRTTRPTQRCYPRTILTTKQVCGRGKILPLFFLFIS